MTNQQALDLLLKLRGWFAGRRQNVDQRELEMQDELFLDAFRQWNYATLDAAIRIVSRRSRFFPTFAEISEAYDEARVPRPELRPARQLLPGPGETRASDEEFAEAMQRVRECLGEVEARRPR